MRLSELKQLTEKGMIRRMGFNPPSEFNVGLSLKDAFEEYHPQGGKGALDSYAEQILSSNSEPTTKESAIKLLNSIRGKADDFKILLDDFNFDDNSDLATTVFSKISGDTDEGELDTLRFWDFNITSSLESGMIENVVGLLDQLDTFFDILVGMLADPSLSTQKPEPKPMGFQTSLVERFQKLANIKIKK